MIDPKLIVSLAILGYIYFAKVSYSLGRYSESNFCRCMQRKSLYQRIKYWSHCLVNTIITPSLETWSELCFATGYLHTYFVIRALSLRGHGKGVVYLRVLGDSRYLNRLERNFEIYNCIRGSQYLNDSYCSSHYYTYSAGSDTVGSSA